MVRSGGGVLCVATAQIVTGVALLGIFEGYKKSYYSESTSLVTLGQNATQASATESLEPPVSAPFAANLDSPLAFLFFFSIINNVFAVLGIAGMFNAQKSLVVAYFCYNAVNLVSCFHIFVDVCATINLDKSDSSPVRAYERAAAATLFFNWLLSICACFFGMRAVDEMKTKQREAFQSIHTFDLNDVPA
mmetsp:Transcript_2326/g.8520  ORF Transcript_2326/g.8520 Transcript_2326/m.8520 type:complete len:190 (-) Transcript_2326:79-648(-)